MSSELDELRATVRDFLATKADRTKGYDDKLWAQMAEQLGLQSLALPAEHGGDGYSLVELSVVLEEMGRALLPSPFLSTVVLTATAIVASGDADAAARYLPGIAAGTTTATLAVPDSHNRWETADLTVTASPALNGTAPIVLDGATADLVLVVAAAPEGPSLYAVDGASLTRTPLRTLDLTRQMARLEFANIPATLVGQPGQAAAVVGRVLDVATAALAAEQVGAARACLEASTSYAKERMQFGRPIGSFQAVKHKCADMFTRVQVADAAAREAAEAIDRPDGSVVAAVAHVVCSEGFMAVASENIQVHGGIGFTWEHPAHLYYRRAKASQLLFGGPAAYHERLLRRAGV